MREYVVWVFNAVEERTTALSGVATEEITSKGKTMLAGGIETEASKDSEEIESRLQIGLLLK